MAPKRYTLGAVSLLLALLVAAPAAWAQDEPKDKAAEEKAGEAPAEETMDEEQLAAKHFGDGRKLYEDGKYNEAIQALLKAYELRPAPPILLNIARTYEKLDDKKNALKFYKEFLLKARMVDPNRPMVENVVKELEKEVGGSTGAVTSDSGTETPDAQRTDDDDIAPIRRKAQLIHTPVDTGKFRKSLTLVAELPPNVDANYLVIHYRKGGELKFRSKMMEEQGEAFIGRIPGKQITSTSLQYYIEAMRKEGDSLKVVATAGTKGTPNIVVVEGGRTLGALRQEAEERKKKPSPYRTWWMVAGGAAGATLGTGLAMSLLAYDRSSAVEKFVKDESCFGDCTRDVRDKQKTAPLKAYDYETKSGSMRDLDKQGRTFATVGYVMFGVGALAAGVTGYFLYKDLTYKRADEDDLETAASQGPRVLAAPWATAQGAGVMGQVSF